jgi:hypothetical protein
VDELKKRIQKTSQKVSFANKDENVKQVGFETEIDKELKKGLLNEKERIEIEKIRDFIEKNQK